MYLRELLLIPALAAVGIAVAPAAVADCNTTAGSTLCTSGGTVRGSAGAPTNILTYDPYPCYGDPTCDYYDIYDPGIAWDLPNIGGGNGIGGGGGIIGGRG